MMFIQLLHISSNKSNKPHPQLLCLCFDFITDSEQLTTVKKEHHMICKIPEEWLIVKLFCYFSRYQISPMNKDMMFVLSIYLLCSHHWCSIRISPLPSESLHHIKTACCCCFFPISNVYMVAYTISYRLICSCLLGGGYKSRRWSWFEPVSCCGARGVVGHRAVICKLSMLITEIRCRDDG
jgi:hypothetical protein